MKKQLLTILMCALVFTTVFLCQIHKQIKQWHQKHSASYNISTSLLAKHPVSEKKPLVVIIPSYNNETVCERNLLSVFIQTYDNYRIVYIDDCSTDKTYEKVQRFIRDQGQEARVTLIRNPVRQLKMPNLYRAYSLCQDHEIIVSLDGDDWLAHENVFNQINQYYQNPDVWLTYGSAINHPLFVKKDGKPFTDEQITTNSIRELPFTMSMLRTFYAGLFKKIQLKDLFYQGRFLPTADDFGFMIPMGEMAGTHALFIPDVLYVINDSNPIRESTVIPSLQTLVRDTLAKRERYNPLDVTFNPRDTRTLAMKTPIDLIILSDDTPLYLKKALDNTLTHFSSLHEITVLFTATTPTTQRAYENLMELFPSVSFVTKTPLQSLLQKTTTPYVALAKDHFVFTEPIDALACVKHLEETGCVQFLLGHNGPPLETIPLNQNLSAISFSTLAKVPELLSQPSFAIYSKEFLLKHTKSPYVSCPNEVALLYEKPVTTLVKID